MKRIQAVIRPEKLDAVQHQLAELDVLGFMVIDVRSHGAAGEAANEGEWRGIPYGMSVKHKLMIDVVVDDDEVATVVQAIQHVAATGQPGDGVIFVLEVAAIVPIRSEAATER